MNRPHARRTACLLAALFALATFAACGSSDSSFGSGSHFRFVVMGDTRGDFEGLELVDTEHFPNLVTEVAALQPAPDFLLFTGDAPALGTQIEWNEWMGIMGPIYEAGIPVYPTLGNHEVFLNLSNEKNIAAFKARFPNPLNGPAGYEGLTFSFDRGSVHVVCLTSNIEWEGTMGDSQIEWLRDDLARSGGRFTVLFFHEPAYPTGAHLGSSLDVDPAQRDKFWTVVDEAGVDLVFNGHEHNYSRWTIDASVNSLWKRKVFQIVSGGAGAPIADELLVTGPQVFLAAYHYIVIEAGNTAMDVVAIDETGATIDRFRVS